MCTFLVYFFFQQSVIYIGGLGVEKSVLRVVCYLQYLSHIFRLRKFGTLIRIDGTENYKIATGRFIIGTFYLRLL